MWHQKKQNTYYIQDNMENEAFNNYRYSEKCIEDILFNEQVLQDIKQLISILPDVQQSVVKMRYFEQMNFNDIAKIENVSVNTALGRMRYALLNMRRIIYNYDIDLNLR